MNDFNDSCVKYFHRHLFSVYEDGSYGYFRIDDDGTTSLWGSKIEAIQSLDEDGRTFLRDFGIDLTPRDYGYNHNLDVKIIELIKSPDSMYISYGDDSFVKINHYGIERLRKHGVACKRILAHAGLFLEELALDPSPLVREEVVNCPMATPELLETMVYDKYVNVRRKLAYKDIGREVLKNDEDARVREIVCDSGYDPEHFLTDTASAIRCSAVRHCDVDTLSKYPELLKDIDPLIETLAKKGVFVNELSTHSRTSIRISLAEQGFLPDVFVNDESEYVRAAVAKCGFKHDILKDDPSRSVRFTVAQYSTPAIRDYILSKNDMYMSDNEKILSSCNIHKYLDPRQTERQYRERVADYLNYLPVEEVLKIASNFINDPTNTAFISRLSKENLRDVISYKFSFNFKTLRNDLVSFYSYYKDIELQEIKDKLFCGEKV